MLRQESKKFLMIVLGILLISVFGLSIAYAILNVTLNISGSAKVTSADWDISIDNVSINNMIELKEYIYSKVPGDKVSVNVSRGYITRNFEIILTREIKRSRLNNLLLGVPGGIRTPDLKVRSLAFYPAKLRAHTFNIIALFSGFFKCFYKICETFSSFQLFLQLPIDKTDINSSLILIASALVALA